MRVGPHTRTASTIGAGALTAAVLAVTSPAGAATGPVSYACTSTATGAFTATVEVDGAPDTVAAGAPIAVTTKITLPDSVRASLYATGARSVDGTAQLTVSGPAMPRTVAHTVARAALGDSGPVQLTATGALTLSEAGDVVLAAGALAPTLQFYAGGQPSGAPVALTCSAPAPAPTIDTVAVTATSTTALALDPVRSSYGDKVLARATVTTTGGPAKGMVVFTLGSQTRKASVKSNGTAETTLRAEVPAKRSYPVSATFQPADTKNVGASTTSQQVSVNKDSTNVRVSVGRTLRGRWVRAVVGINSVHGADVTGRVQVILKRGGKTLRVKTKSLRDERRTVWLIPVYRLGRHTVQVKYLGQPDFRKSSDKAAFYVVRR
jgi:hypothetical protein